MWRNRNRTRIRVREGHRARHRRRPLASSQGAVVASQVAISRAMRVMRTGLNGSPGRIRTSDLTVNSRPLYRLSYRGAREQALFGNRMAARNQACRPPRRPSLVVRHTRIGDNPREEREKPRWAKLSVSKKSTANAAAAAPAWPNARTWSARSRCSGRTWSVAAEALRDAPDAPAQTEWLGRVERFAAMIRYGLRMLGEAPSDGDLTDRLSQIAPSPDVRGRGQRD